MIEELLKEMIQTCGACQGTGVIQDEAWKTGAIIEYKCIECLGVGKVLSYEGEKLRRLVLTGVIDS